MKKTSKQSKNNLYWITYTNGTTSYFSARTPEEAFRYFIQEGDHALDYGKRDDGSRT